MKVLQVCLLLLWTSLSNAKLTKLGRLEESITLPPRTGIELVSNEHGTASGTSAGSESDQFSQISEIITILKAQDWPSDERRCFNQTILLLESVQNFTLWSTWAWDSMNTQPIGQFFGTRHHLGNFDECLRSPWSHENPELRTQYCLADVKLGHPGATLRNHSVDPYWSTFEFLQYRDKYSRLIDRLAWGVCLPSFCKSASAQKLAEAMLSKSHLAMPGVKLSVSIDSCQVLKQSVLTRMMHDWGFLAFVALMILLTIVTSVCTYINMNIKQDSDSMSTYIVRAFCVKENSKNLLKLSEDGLEVLYGIRFLSVVLIVMGHQILNSNNGPISNGWVTDKELDSYAANLVIHIDLLVDTFFMMSGLLVMRAFMAFEKLPNVFVVILKRYIRLVPGVAVVIFYMCTVMKYTGDGPLWSKFIGTEIGFCLKNWWTNVLMVNNFINTQEMCYYNTWYIPNDFQMFLIATILFWISCMNRKLGFIVPSVTAVASVAVPAYLTYKYDLTALTVMTHEVQQDYRNDFSQTVFYIKVYNRFGAYIVGLAAGYIFARHKPTAEGNRLSQKTAIIGAASGITIMLATMLYGAKLHRQGWGQVEGILFAALNRPVWAFGLALLALCCAYGSVPLITPILTWYPWVPLSRLAFGIYLTHGLVIFRNVYVTRNLIHFDQGNIGVDTLGVTVVSTIIAYQIWILVEAPVNNLFMIAFVPRHLLKKVMAKELTKKDITKIVADIEKNNEKKESMQDELREARTKI